MQSVRELATGRSAISDVRGATSFTAYPLTPAIFLKQIIDAAKERYLFTQFAYVTKLAQGQKDIVIPKRTAYLRDTGFTWQTTEPAAGTAITATKLDNLDGLTLTPAMQGARVSISNQALRTNSIDLMNAAREEFIEAIGDKVDIATATALRDAGEADSDQRGASTVYGGDARADSELAAGDTITTDMWAEAKRKLMSTSQKYWTPASPAAEATSSQAKNPWMPTPEEPFVLFIRPEQEEVFVTDSQFMNAAEYGSNKVVMKGEIGEYIGTKVIVSNNTPAIAASGTAPDGGSTPSVAMTRCIMIKSKKAVALAWGMEPQIKAWDYPIELAQELILETSYQAGILHADAICFLDVADA